MELYVKHAKMSFTIDMMRRQEIDEKQYLILINLGLEINNELVYKLLTWWSVYLKSWFPFGVG